MSFAWSEEQQFANVSVAGIPAAGLEMRIVDSDDFTRALPKDGSCPSGYNTSGNYCNPGSSARYAVTKDGSCPSGYNTSGNYCVAGRYARLAVPKSGSCPSGFSTSGSYCLKQ